MSCSNTSKLQITTITPAGPSGNANIADGNHVTLPVYVIFADGEQVFVGFQFTFQDVPVIQFIGSRYYIFTWVWYLDVFVAFFIFALVTIHLQTRRLFSVINGWYRRKACFLLKVVKHGQHLVIITMIIVNFLGFMLCPANWHATLDCFWVTCGYSIPVIGKVRNGKVRNGKFRNGNLGIEYWETENFGNSKLENRKFRKRYIGKPEMSEAETWETKKKCKTVNLVSVTLFHHLQVRVRVRIRLRNARCLNWATRRGNRVVTNE